MEEATGPISNSSGNQDCVGHFGTTSSTVFLSSLRASGQRWASVTIPSMDWPGSRKIDCSCSLMMQRGPFPTIMRVRVQSLYSVSTAAPWLNSTEAKCQARAETRDFIQSWSGHLWSCPKWQTSETIIFSTLWKCFRGKCLSYFETHKQVHDSLQVMW